jgi:Immunoglobulin domain/Immunoglobulin I-set domain
LQAKFFVAASLAMVFFAGCAGFVRPGTTGATSGPASIVVQPTNQSVAVGQAANFSVTAGGAAPLTYQWLKNGVALPGATSSSYRTPATTSADNGTRFEAMVSNSLGTITSIGAILHVSTSGSGSSGPSITTQPANASAAPGQTAAFSVTAGGTAPLTYQWQKNTINISGATLAVYTTPATTIADNGEQYRVLVSNATGSVTSTSATLTVTSSAFAPAISVQPVNDTVIAGQAASFSVTATGSPAPTYQWKKNGANISGATSHTYTTPATVAGDSGSAFDVVVSNSAGSVTSRSAILTVTSAATAPAITVQPANDTVTVGQAASFSLTATGSPAPSYQWKKNGASISGATSHTYTTPATVAGDTGAAFDVVVSNSAGSVTSNTATLTVNTVTTPPAAVDVVTYHYDNLRTGQNVNETTLTTGNVNSSKFGKLGSFSVDGKVDGQPLYLSNVSIPGKGTKNVLYVVTEHDSIYAFDADSVSGSSSTVLWKASALKSGESSSDDRGCGQVTPEIGITSTPVIDRTRNAIYLVSVSKDGNGNYFHRIHALDLTNGNELFGGPTTVAATYPGSGANSSNGNVVFDARSYNERAGLLQIGGTIYTSWGSHCDAGSYTSWVMSYSADTLQQTKVLNLVPNGSEGGIWMSGAAPAADASGNIYLIVGNGDFDTSLNGSGFPANGNCGNCYVKMSPGLQLLDYFTPQNTVSESGADTDFGSGGPVLLPDLKDGQGNTRHLAVGSGKDANIYVVDRDNMGKFNSGSDNIYQQLNGQLGGGVWAKPSYFNGTVYYGAVNDVVKAFHISSGRLSTSPSSQGAHQFGYPGTAPSISASGSSNGIVWAVENASPAVLHAYDATNVGNELYNSNQASNGRDNFSGNKYITPVVVNGKVYVATPNSVVAFGLLP